MKEYFTRAAKIFCCLVGFFAALIGVGWLLGWAAEHFGFIGVMVGICLLASLLSAGMPGGGTGPR